MYLEKKKNIYIYKEREREEREMIIIMRYIVKIMHARVGEYRTSACCTFI